MVFTLWHEGINSPWSPDFKTKPLSANIIGPVSARAAEGGQFFYEKGCQFCHSISGYGGHRGPDLTTVALRLSKDEMTFRVVNGGDKMPAYGAILSHHELDNIIQFLQTRKSEIKGER
jgi:ubiquinol-cytochrome c reductase cytochrome b subunit